jgi:Cu(I)/Ag(I) efflux system membrane fusion protein
MNRPAYFVLLFSSIAGAFLVGTLYNHRAAAGSRSTEGRRILYYTDPMHPAYKSDKPGTAPDCGMKLEPVYADGGPSGVSEDGGLPSALPGAVKIDDRKQQLGGVIISPVEKASGVYALRLFGRVAPDEARTYRLNAGIEGYIQEVSPVTTGSQVKKNQLLATFSAPGSAMSIQTYLVNLGAEDQYRKSAAEGSVDAQNLPSVDAGLLQRRQQMQNMGMSSLQIEELKRTRQYPETIKIVAPADGLVLSRNVSPGLKFDRGAEWYRIADLSKVWVMADVFERDAKYIRPGQIARVTLAAGGAAGGAAVLSARVSDVLPQFDPTSRTYKVRLEMDNPSLALRPDVFVDVQLRIALPEAITVPVEAVLDSGLKKTVYVDRGEGIFEPRQVETGRSFDGRVQILAGLEAGERIVTSGNFLLDSESRMKQAEAAPHGAEKAAEKAQTKDPVCGMDLAGPTQFQGESADQHFFFCSSECKHKFEKEPGLYLHKATGGRRHGGPQS